MCALQTLLLICVLYKVAICQLLLNAHEWIMTPLTYIHRDFFLDAFVAAEALFHSSAALGAGDLVPTRTKCYRYWIIGTHQALASRCRWRRLRIRCCFCWRCCWRWRWFGPVYRLSSLSNDTQIQQWLPDIYSLNNSRTISLTKNESKHAVTA